ncbi:oxidoreductase [Streptomyces sp. 150FB]|nr:oxidoreductase [Streptomyces sp. 150FB]
MHMATTTQKVVVIGGGYAGVKLARELDETAQVTLIDRKEAFFHRIASLRASVDDAWTHAPFVPYDKLLDHGKVLLAKAVAIRPAERDVVLATGEHLPYDVLVVATGADYQEPARFTGTTVEEAAKAFRAHQQQTAQARSILVVGGGPSGVELTAQLRQTYPNARLTLAHSGSVLLSSSKSLRLGRRAQAWLEGHGVTVLLDTFVSASGGSSRFQDQAGNAMGADVAFWTTGTTPNTLWLRLAGHGGWLDAGGHVKVDSHLRVLGHRDIFAIGDVNDVAEAKLSPSAMAQGDAAAHNIRAYLQRGSKHGKQPQPYKPAPVRLFSVPFGPEGGGTVLPMLGKDAPVLGNRPTVAMKSRSLMVPYVRHLLRQPRG